MIAPEITELFEIVKLIPKIDISTLEKCEQFNNWKFNDGTLEGLQELYKKQQNEKEIIGVVTT